MIVQPGQRAAQAIVLWFGCEIAFEQPDGLLTAPGLVQQFSGNRVVDRRVFGILSRKIARLGQPGIDAAAFRHDPDQVGLDRRILRGKVERRL